MLRIENRKDEIIVRELPFVEWITFFVFAVILALMAYASYKNSSQWFWILGIAGLVNFYFLLTKPLTTTKINKPGKTVSVRKQSLIKYTFNVYSFSEIDDLIYVGDRKSGRSGKSYQLIMPLKNGQKIELSLTDGSQKNDYFKVADLMNSYIFDTSGKLGDSKQIPFKLTMFSD